MYISPGHPVVCCSAHTFRSFPFTKDTCWQKTLHLTIAVHSLDNCSTLCVHMYTEASPAGATLLGLRHRIPSSTILGRCLHLWWTATSSCCCTGAGPGCERLLHRRCYYFPAKLYRQQTPSANELGPARCGAIKVKTENGGAIGNSAALCAFLDLERGV